MKLLNEYGAAIGIIVSVFSTVLAIYFYLKTRVKKEMKYNHRETFSIIQFPNNTRPNELEILWKKQKLSNVFKTEIYLKNTGTTALKKEDFHKHINISFNKGVELLQAKVFSSTEYSKLNWDAETRSVWIDVDVIESKEYIKIGILYSNENLSSIDLELAIIDGNTGKLKLEDQKPTLQEDSKLNVKRMSIIAVLVLAGLSLLSIVFMFLALAGIYFYGFILMVFVIGVFRIYYLKRKFESFKNIKWIEFKSQSHYKKMNAFLSNYLSEDAE